MEQLELFPELPPPVKRSMDAIDCLQLIERRLAKLERMQIQWYLNELWEGINRRGKDT
jgi:hypothetical protein